MERGPPDAKRSRVEYHQLHSPTAYDVRYDPGRALPIPGIPPGPPPQPEGPPRRHSDYNNHADPRSRPYEYNGPGPRDTIMKQDPSLEQRPQLDVMRPNSTGHHPIHQHRRPVDDMRPYDHPNITNGSLSATTQYMPPPQYPDRPYYEPPMSEGSREPIYPIEVGFTSSSSSTQKKRSARTTQACEACRHAKAKCTDPKPCQGCIEKGIDCKYDPPPPKQSDKVSSEVTNQIESLRDFLEKESERHRKEEKKEMERQIQQDRKLDAILKAIAKFAPEINLEVEGENHLPVKSEEDTSASVQPSIEGSDDSGEIDDQLKRDISIRETAHRPRSERSIPPVDPTYFNDLALNIDSGAPKKYYSGEDTYGDAAIPANDGRDTDVIPFRHTTGSHYVLQWRSVIKLWKGALVKPESVEKFDPYTMEMSRGIVHLHGTGQGYEKVSMDVNYTRETTGSVSGSDSSDSAPSPIVEKSWGIIGNSPDPEPPLHRFNPHDLKPDRSPPFDDNTVRTLANAYMDTLNIMHPIITKHGLEQLTRLFLKEIAVGRKNHHDNNVVSASFLGHEKKRKRDSPSRQTIVADDIRLPYTMSTATMLLVLALGKICNHKQKVPPPPPAPDAPAAVSPPSITFSQSPSPAQRSATLPHSRTVRPSPSSSLPSHESSSETHSGLRYPHDVKNVDVIPGLAYFALAANILGDHEGENNLQMVQACLLAGLYHGQLGRPLQSYSYIYRAGVCMQWILPQSRRDYFASRPRVDFDTTVPGTEEHEANNKRKRKENHTLFLFWTCLQLESDILAELDCPKRSGILEMEPFMPWPHTDVACKDGDMNEIAKQCYMTQLNYRNHLNGMHKDLYGPSTSLAYSPPKLMNANYVKSELVNVIEALIDNLNSWTSLSPKIAWKDEDPPADNILEARLRGKFYGAQNITYRHFLRAVLDSDRKESFPEKVVEYAKNCVMAMKHSCLAFTNCMGPGERLIVTNCWGTAHAQWGNTVVLHAVFNNKLLKDCIKKPELIAITTKVRNFLLEVAQHGSAIEMDLRFLDAVAKETGILDQVLAQGSQSAATSFCSNGIAEQRGTSLTPTSH